MTFDFRYGIINHVASEQRFGGLAQLGEHLPYKQRVTGSSPVVPTNKKVSFVYRTKETFLNDVCLRQMMLAPPMMTASPDDVASLMFVGKHRIIANEMSNIIMRSITSYRRQPMHH